MRLDKLDYALLDGQCLPQLAIKCIKTEGATPHLDANGAMHRDLVELTVQKVANLAYAMMPPNRVRVTEKQVRLMLLEALKTGALDRPRMPATLLDALEPPSS